MTGKKTGALIATATELGGLVGGGTHTQVAALRRFGLRLGRAFQVQDDILDAVGHPHDFGKTIGGDILEGKKIPLGKIADFRERLRHRLYEIVVAEFLKQCKEQKLTRAELARRIGRKPEQVTRGLGAPGNWTLDTVSDLMLGMGAEVELSVASLREPSPARPPNGNARRRLSSSVSIAYSSGRCFENHSLAGVSTGPENGFISVTTRR